MSAAVLAGSARVTKPSTAMNLPKMATADMSSRATPAVTLAVRIDHPRSRERRVRRGRLICWSGGYAVRLVMAVPFKRRSAPRSRLPLDQSLRTMYAYAVRYTYSVRASRADLRETMAVESDSRPGPRAPWTRTQLLRAAIDFADPSGIESLSMRKLSQELGGGTMSLYNHVANKDDLLDGMIDTVFSEIELPADEGWKTAMRQRALSVRTVMTRHPWAIGLMESRSTPGPATLRHHDAVIGCLRDAGFPFRWPRTRSQPSTATSTVSPCRSEAWRSGLPRRPRNSQRPFCSTSRRRSTRAWRS